MVETGLSRSTRRSSTSPHNTRVRKRHTNRCGKLRTDVTTQNHPAKRVLETCSSTRQNGTNSTVHGRVRKKIQRSKLSPTSRQTASRCVSWSTANTSATGVTTPVWSSIRKTGPCKSRGKTDEVKRFSLREQPTQQKAGGGAIPM